MCGEWRDSRTLLQLPRYTPLLRVIKRNNVEHCKLEIIRKVAVLSSLAHSSLLYYPDATRSRAPGPIDLCLRGAFVDWIGIVQLIRYPFDYFNLFHMVSTHYIENKRTLFVAHGLAFQENDSLSAFN